jgi:hypothetical protein
MSSATDDIDSKHIICIYLGTLWQASKDDQSNISWNRKSGQASVTFDQVIVSAGYRVAPRGCGGKRVRRGFPNRESGTKLAPGGRKYRYLHSSNRRLVIVTLTSHSILSICPMSSRQKSFFEQDHGSKVRDAAASRRVAPRV